MTYVRSRDQDRTKNTSVGLTNMLVCIDGQDFLRNRQVFNQEPIQEENAVCLMIHIIVGCKNLLSVIKQIDDQGTTFRKRKIMLCDELIQKG